VIADVVGCVEAPDVADRAIDLGRDLYVHGSLLDVPEMADSLLPQRRHLPAHSKYRSPGTDRCSPERDLLG
jgi:hypothetical protein